MHRKPTVTEYYSQQPTGKVKTNLIQYEDGILVVSGVRSEADYNENIIAIGEPGHRILLATEEWEHFKQEVDNWVKEPLANKTAEKYQAVKHDAYKKAYNTLEKVSPKIKEMKAQFEQIRNKAKLPEKVVEIERLLDNALKHILKGEK